MEVAQSRSTMAATYSLGENVSIHSLRSKPELNGKLGMVTGFNGDRVVVQIEGEAAPIALKMDNLEESGLPVGVRQFIAAAEPEGTAAAAPAAAPTAADRGASPDASPKRRNKSAAKTKPAREGKSDAFKLYCSKKRAKVVTENPGASTSDIAKILADKWERISDERRNNYEAEAKKLKEDFKARQVSMSKKRKEKKRPRSEETEEDDDDDVDRE